MPAPAPATAAPGPAPAHPRTGSGTLSAGDARARMRDLPAAVPPSRRRTKRLGARIDPFPPAPSFPPSAEPSRAGPQRPIRLSLHFHPGAPARWPDIPPSGSSGVVCPRVHDLPANGLQRLDGKRIGIHVSPWRWLPDWRRRDQTSFFHLRYSGCEPFMISSSRTVARVMPQ